MAPAWLLVVEFDGQVAGGIQYHEEHAPMYRHAGIGIFLGTSFQGRGIGPEAIGPLVGFLFERRGHHRITIDPAAANAGGGDRNPRLPLLPHQQAMVIPMPVPTTISHLDRDRDAACTGRTVSGLQCAAVDTVGLSCGDLLMVLALECLALLRAA